jgi:hypothetical protein
VFVLLLCCSASFLLRPLLFLLLFLFLLLPSVLLLLLGASGSFSFLYFFLYRLGTTMEGETAATASSPGTGTGTGTSAPMVVESPSSGRRRSTIKVVSALAANLPSSMKRRRSSNHVSNQPAPQIVSTWTNTSSSATWLPSSPLASASSSASSANSSPSASPRPSTNEDEGSNSNSDQVPHLAARLIAQKRASRISIQVDPSVVCRVLCTIGSRGTLG